MSQDIAEQAVEAFNEVDGIEASYALGGGVVKVFSEDAIGHFFRIRREVEAEVYAVTRNDLDETVLDALVS